MVLAISFVASVQSSIFTKLDRWSYNSVIATGNLRRATESLFNGLSRHRDTNDLEQLKKFGAVSLSFLVGAGLGAVATNLFGNAATAGAAVLLILALLLCLSGERRGMGTGWPF
ncbi:YoaK family protein [Rhizobium miluonense]|uniref:YoaK family protein n=1 Tax=Rhizobium miluonense TaxID=411945 RepID=UPI0038621CD2